MITLFFQKIYDSNQSLKNKSISKVACLITRTLSNIIIPFWFQITPKNKLSSKTENKPLIIISLTSFPNRIPKVWVVIESLMRQSFKPDKIILHLSKEQIPDKELLPNSLLNLCKRGLEIEFHDEDLRSHKKYYYSFLKYSKEIVITVDDDIIYPKNTIQELVVAHKSHPGCVIARYAHHIKIQDNIIQPYNEWNENKYSKNPNFRFFFGSGGGTLFPVCSINKDIYNKSIFMSICKLADDIWLNAYIRHSKLNIYLINNKSCSILNIQIKQDERLTTQNVEKNMNDIQIKNVCDYFILMYNYNPFLLEQQ